MPDVSIYFDATRDRWVADVLDSHGKRRKRSIKHDPAWDKLPYEQQKKKAAKALKPKIDELVKEVREGTRSNHTYKVEDAVNDFIASGLKGRARATITQARSLGKHQIIAHIGEKRLKDLRCPDVDSWLEKLSRELSSKTLRQVHLLLTRSIRHAQRDELINKNVSALCETPPGQAGRPSTSMTLSVKRDEQGEIVELSGEVIDLLKAAQDDPFGPYVILALLSGIRTEEARALQWKDVHLDDKENGPHIVVLRSVREHGDTKTKKSRRALALPAMAVEALKAHKTRQAAERLAAGPVWQDHGLVFPRADGTRMDAMTALRAFRRLLKKTGITVRYSLRELRHTYASVRSLLGAKLEDISGEMGHATTHVTERIYRQELRPVIVAGALSMNAAFKVAEGG
ncbi:site-specific integrase [Spirillospora sp. CA-294931]|uniref:site-specific integrase n=1 Tax=Spirillospora sp. CA-294931 TaxID=3240042 RepID=UPI003D930176